MSSSSSPVDVIVPAASSIISMASSLPATASSNASTSTSTAAKAPDPSQTLALHALYFILAFAGVCMLVRIPRAIASSRGNRGKSKGGWVLWYSDSDLRTASGGGHEVGRNGSYRYPPANVPRDIGVQDSEAEGTEDEKVEGGEYPRRMYQHPHRHIEGKTPVTDLPKRGHHARRNAGRHHPHPTPTPTPNNGQRTLRLPPHVPAYPALLRALAVPMRSRFPFINFASLTSFNSGFASTASSSSNANRNSLLLNGNSNALSASSRSAYTTSSNITSYTLAQTLLLAVYTFPLLYALFAHGSNPLADPVRSGFLSVVQIPVAVALAAKNGVMGFGIGGYGVGGGGTWGYERINWLHRWVGRAVVLGVNAHCWRYFYLWTLAGTYTKNISAPAMVWGMVGLVAVNMMFLFSLKSVRERAFGFFLVTHIVGFILLLVAVYIHMKFLPNVPAATAIYVFNYVLAATAIYAFDHLLRLLKTRITHARLVPLQALDMTRIEIPKLNRGWRAGQHVRLRVLDPHGVCGGWLKGWMEVHPFTIAGVEGGEEGMVLMCKRAGGWTRGLFDLAKTGGGAGSGSARENGVGVGRGREVRVVVEGPYGGPGNTNVASFSAAVYICGGSGITYALAGISDLVERDFRGESRVKVVELVWVVPDPGCLEPLLPTFADLIHRSVHTPLRISVFYTRAPTGKQPAYFDAVDASPFAAPPPTPAPYPYPQPAAIISEDTDVDVTAKRTPRQQQRRREDDDQQQPSHTLVSPLSEDAQDFAQAYQQRLEKQRTARPRPPPSQRPSSPYESPRAAPAPPPPSAYTPPKTKNTNTNANANGTGRPDGPQRQDSNASARTLVDASGYGYQHKSSLKRTQTSASRYRDHHQRQQNQHLPQNLTLAPGRPKLSHFLEHALDRALRLSHSDLRDGEGDSDYEYEYEFRKRRGGGGGGRGEGKLCGMVVSVCGPAALAGDVCGAVAGLDWSRTQRVGGVEIVEEVFGS